MNENSSRAFRHYWVVLPAFAATAIAVCGLSDPWDIRTLLGAGLCALFWRRSGIGLTLADLLVLAVLGWELVLSQTSINPAPGLRALQDLTAAVFLYFALRLGFHSRGRLRALLTADSLLFGLLAGVGIAAFYLFRQRMIDGGLGEDLYDFRALCLPLGQLPNVWSNLLLGFLGTVLLALRYARRGRFWLIICLMVVGYGLILTFSRGVYIAIGFLLLGFAVAALVTRKPPRGRKIAVTIAVTAGCALFILPNRTEVARTLQMHGSVSQQRSTETRLTAARTAWTVLAERPLTGAGSGNYSLLVNPYLYENNPDAFTANASSFPIQIVTEKGIVGTLLWAALLVACIAGAIRTRRRSRTPLLVVLLTLTLLLREATFPVLLGNGGLMMILFIWLAVLQNECRPKTFLRLPGWARWVPLGLWAGLLTATLLSRPATGPNPRDFKGLHDRALSLAQQGHRTEAVALLDSLVTRFPDNPLYRVSRFRLAYADSQTDEAAGHLAHAVRYAPALLDTRLCTDTIAGDSALSAAFLPLLTADPRHTIDRARQARIALYLGDTLRAQRYWETTVRELPSLPRPWCYLGMLAYHRGDETGGRRYLKAALAIAPADPLARRYWESLTGETLPPTYAPLRDEYAFLYEVYEAKQRLWYGKLP